MKRKFSKRPVENHETASWANINKTKKDSNVSVPSLEQIANAKEHVDENEK